MTASAAEVPAVPTLLDSLRANGFVPATCAMDKGHDAARIYDGCEGRGIRPIVPLLQTGRVVKGEDNKPPTCDHGTWKFAGPTPSGEPPSTGAPLGSATRRACGSKLTASTRSCLVARTGGRPSTGGRAGFKREFGRLKHEWALLPLRVRRVERVALHVDLTVLGRLALALSEAPVAVPLAA